jgi:hypothetical protein
MLATDVSCQLSLAISLRITPTGVMRVNFAGLVPAPTAGASVGIESWRP